MTSSARRFDDSATESEARVSNDVADVIAARSGDRSAFRRLYERHARAVRGLFVASLPGDADDLLQEAFLDAWRALPSLREEQLFGPWLCTIARNRLRRALRGRRREPRTVELDEDHTAPATHADAPLDRAGVLRALATLPEAYREALAMRLVEGTSGPEIARLTGRTEGSVRVHLSRGMRLLREALTRTGADFEERR